MLSHIGQIERIGGIAFSSDDVAPVLEALTYLFWFAKGRYTSPLLAVGYGVDGHRKWEKWTPMRQSSWQDNLSWFPENHPKALADLFPIILHMIHEQTWYEPLKLAISWYVQANNAPTMESGIIMAQVGMELLAWVEMVEKKAIISKEGFDKLTTTDKLRLFFSWARIPVSLPSELVALKALADGSSQKNQRWEDGPEALVEFRNSVTHARRRDRVSNASTEALWDTHKLALWYLELSILHVLGYQGLYTCRIRTNLFRGQHEFVPWRMDNTKG